MLGELILDQNSYLCSFKTHRHNMIELRRNQHASCLGQPKIDLTSNGQSTAVKIGTDPVNRHVLYQP